MTDDDVTIGPLIYAVSRGLRTYREAYREAASAYKNLTGNEIESGENIIMKIIGSATGEIEKSSELDAENFLKNYQKFETLFSIAKKFLG